MNISKKFNEIAVYQGRLFEEWFGSLPFENKKAQLEVKPIPTYTTDPQLIKVHKSILSFGEVYEYLKNKAQKDKFMVFHAKDKNGVVRAVRVRWYVCGWIFGAFPIRPDVGWNERHCVLSKA